MSNLASVDRLNIIFFGEMEIPAEEKKRRVAFASAFDRIMRKYYDTIQSILKFSFDNVTAAVVTPLAMAAAALTNEYRKLVERYYPELSDVQGWVDAHTRQFSVWVTQTRREAGTPVTENDILTAVRTEVNTVGNLALLYMAAKQGKKLKRWKTFGDNRVRPSHVEAGGQTVPISEPFIIGGYQMMFPGDSSLGAPAGEIVNCRCSVEYI